jgi:hypothetical protein
MPVHHARRKLERLGRIEEILGAGGLQQRDQRQQRRKKTDKTGMEFLSGMSGHWSNRHSTPSAFFRLSTALKA